MTREDLNKARGVIADRFLKQVLEEGDSSTLPWYMRLESTALAFEWVANNLEHVVLEKYDEVKPSVFKLTTDQLRLVAMNVRRKIR